MTVLRNSFGLRRLPACSQPVNGKRANRLRATFARCLVMVRFLVTGSVGEKMKRLRYLLNDKKNQAGMQ
jgi:hypothetical protein